VGVEQLSPVLLQAAALWLLLLALLLADDPPAAARPRVPEPPTDRPAPCPFCGAVYEGRCWCGSDGHWL
jgi:hypothetical protein